MSQVPLDIGAEQAVLGSVLMRVDALPEVSGWLLPADFYDEHHRLIYDAMLALSASATPADLRTVSAELRQRGQLATIGGLPALASLADAVPTSHHIAHYGRIVQRCAILRRLIAAGGQIAQLAVDTPDVDQALALAQAALQHLESAASAGASGGPVLLSELMAQDLPAVRWIIPDLLPEGLTLLCGKPKQGKSWMSLGFALAVAAGGCVLGHVRVEQGEVLYIALEDNSRRLKARVSKLLAESPFAGLPFWSATSWPRLDAGGLSRLRVWLDQHPACRLVVIDTIGLIRSAPRRGEQPYDADYRAMRELKALADDRGIAIVGVHHRTKAETEDAIDSVSGSTGLTGAVDGFLVLSRQRGAADASLFVTGRDIENESELALLWDSLTAQWTSAGDASEYRLSRERQDIIDALGEAGQPVYPRELADLTGQKSNNLYQLLRRMAADGLVVRCPDGRYCLPGAEHDRAVTADHAQDHGARRTTARQNGHHDRHDRHDRPKQHDPQIMPIMPIMDHGPRQPAPAGGAPQSDPGPQYARVNWSTAALLAASNTPGSRARLITFCTNWGAPLDGVLSHIAQMQGAQS